MRITISGMPGSGKSTIAKRLAEKYKLKNYSVGDFRRQMAAKRGISIAELNKIGEKERWTDEEADKWQIKLGKSKDNFIIDGRISYYFIPNSIKIFLDVNLREATKRIGKAKREEEKADSEKELLAMLKERIKSDIKRYKKYYSINPYNKEDYDFYLDTTNLSREEVFKKIVGFIEGRKS